MWERCLWLWSDKSPKAVSQTNASTACAHWSSVWKKIKSHRQPEIYVIKTFILFSANAKLIWQVRLKKCNCHRWDFFVITYTHSYVSHMHRLVHQSTWCRPGSQSHSWKINFCTILSPWLGCCTMMYFQILWYHSPGNLLGDLRLNQSKLAIYCLPCVTGTIFLQMQDKYDYQILNLKV